MDSKITGKYSAALVRTSRQHRFTITVSLGCGIRAEVAEITTPTRTINHNNNSNNNDRGGGGDEEEIRRLDVSRVKSVSRME